jgi:hypothetical protein
MSRAANSNTARNGGATRPLEGREGFTAVFLSLRTHRAPECAGKLISVGRGAHRILTTRFIQVN